jgi:hypothetical protein
VKLLVRLLADSRSTQTVNSGDKDLTSEKNAAWCTVDVDNRIFQAWVVHVGRGKFRVLKDNQSNEYSGKVIDAENILSCDARK